jgi:hypothetical protein
MSTRGHRRPNEKVLGSIPAVSLNGNTGIDICSHMPGQREARDCGVSRNDESTIVQD